MVYLASEMEKAFCVRKVFCVRERASAYGGPAVGEACGEAPVLSADAPTPDPQDDCDALEELEEEIVVLAARIHAATHRLLTLIADFDRREGWKLGGHRSCAHWLHYRTGIDLGAAREKVRAARVLEGLPETSAAMSRGELSFSKVRALTRVADADNESEILELARGCTTAELERLIRAYRIGSRATEAELEQRRHESRRFSVFPGDDGMYVVNGRLDPEVGALLMRAVEAASDALYREGDGPWLPEAERSKKAAQLRADAVGLLAERAMAVGFARDPDHEGATGAASSGNGSGGSVTGSGESVTGSGESVTGSGGSVPISGTRAERYQVVVHVEERALEADTESGRSHLEDGTRVSAETSRRLSCDAGVVRMERASNGSILDAGRRTRTISPALRRALEARDQGCRFPGCGLRFTDAHHVKHWADGGKTNLGNTLLLCRHHHRLVHEGGWQVKWQDNGHPAFLDPRGGFHFDGRWDGRLRVGTTETGETRPGKTHERRAADVSAETFLELPPRLPEDFGEPGPNAWTGSARWKREADIPREVLLPAIEAIGEAGP